MVLFSPHLVTDFSDEGFEHGIMLEMERQSKAKTFHVRAAAETIFFYSHVGVGFSAANSEHNPIFRLCVTQQAHLLPSSPPLLSLLPSTMTDTETIEMKTKFNEHV